MEVGKAAAEARAATAAMERAAMEAEAQAAAEAQAKAEAKGKAETEAEAKAVDSEVPKPAGPSEDVVAAGEVASEAAASSAEADPAALRARLGELEAQARPLGSCLPPHPHHLLHH